MMKEDKKLSRIFMPKKKQNNKLKNFKNNWRISTLLIKEIKHLHHFRLN